jgi:hypothetical protein
MRRRKLFTLAAGASAVLGIVVAAVWAVGYAHPVRHVHTSSAVRERIVLLGRGNIYYIWTRTELAESGPMPDRPSVDYKWSLFGLRYASSRNYYPGGTFTAREVIVPCWMALLASALLPAASVVTRKRRQRTVGVCYVCGYDLRATPERCPECGAVAERAGPAGPRGC